MRIKFETLRPVRKVIGTHTWNKGDVQDVQDPDLIAVLITDPAGEFTIDPADPLAALVGADYAGAFALEGITHPVDLNALMAEDLVTMLGIKKSKAEALLSKINSGGDNSADLESGGDNSASDTP